MKLVKHIKTQIGLEYTYLSRTDDIGLFKFRLVTRKFRIIPYCGVEAAMCMDGTKILSDTIKPVYIEEIDGIKTEKTIYFNKNGETYVNLFKRHKDIKAKEG